MAAQEARSLAERRYLDGRAALFPDAVSQWALAQELAVMADRLAELDGLPPPAPPDAEAVSARAAMLLGILSNRPVRRRSTRSTKAARRS